MTREQMIHEIAAADQAAAGASNNRPYLKQARDRFKIAPDYQVAAAWEALRRRVR